MKKWLAARLRNMAGSIDPDWIPRSERWHRVSVSNMNTYIGKTEGYICELERRVNLVMDEAELNRLRIKYGRFDTKSMVDEGVWN